YRDGPSDQPLTVKYIVLTDPANNNSAKPDVDYHKLSGTITIPPGASSADIVVRPMDNLTFAGSKQISVKLVDPLADVASQPAYMLGSPDAAVVSVSGPRATISIATQTDASRQRNGTSETDVTGTFQVTLSQSSPTAVTVNYTVDSASTAADGDYVQ